jgi:hypothetical protein
VPVTSAPQRIEQGVEFTLQLNASPRAARLSFDESGLPWGSHLVVWINQQRAGTVTPEVPDLSDVGFPAADSTAYVGWRHGSIYLPVAVLRTGLNSLQLAVENDVGDNPGDDNPNSPLAVNHLVCQFNYASVPASLPAPPASTDLKLEPSSMPPTPAFPTVPAPEDASATPGASASAPADGTGPLNPSSTDTAPAP